MELPKFDTHQSVIEKIYPNQNKVLVNEVFPHISSLEMEPSIGMEPTILSEDLRGVFE